MAIIYTYFCIHLNERLVRVYVLFEKYPLFIFAVLAEVTIRFFQTQLLYKRIL